MPTYTDKFRKSEAFNATIESYLHKSFKIAIVVSWRKQSSVLVFQLF